LRAAALPASQAQPELWRTCRLDFTPDLANDAGRPETVRAPLARQRPDWVLFDAEQLAQGPIFPDKTGH